ncbi:hypothetical protein LWM68_21420 [Niabella sp. W65]|nr:hypothetical protein [Niabella sp. W65]MCH7365091.1 hypothetical protein [Niabella sp. W65]
MLCAAILYSCSKTSNDQLNIDKAKIYVRIAQVDKDGTVTYSKTVLVNQEK